MSHTRWRDYHWGLIRATPVLPYMQMALDEVLTDAVGAGRRTPTLRIWQWAKPVVIIGRYQSLKNEVDPEAARRYGITVVRRITGGGAIFSEPEDTFAYSVYAPEALVRGMSFQESYEFMDAWVIEALRSMGIKASYQPLNDITSPLGKIGGAAQARRHGAVLHHAAIAYNIDAAKMLQVLRIGREKISDKGIASAAKRVDPLRSQTGLARSVVIERMIETFRALHGLSEAPLQPAEIQAAQALVESKFKTPEWTGIVP
ncbi:MAG: lipoate--protein ligase family protein [Gammaproteobacteria bacterium]